MRHSRVSRHSGMFSRDGATSRGSIPCLYRERTSKAWLWQRHLWRTRAHTSHRGHNKGEGEQLTAVVFVGFCTSLSLSLLSFSLLSLSLPPSSLSRGPISTRFLRHARLQIVPAGSGGRRAKRNLERGFSMYVHNLLFAFGLVLPDFVSLERPSAGVPAVPGPVGLCRPEADVVLDAGVVLVLVGHNLLALRSCLSRPGREQRRRFSHTNFHTVSRCPIAVNHPKEEREEMKMSGVLLLKAFSLSLLRSPLNKQHLPGRRICDLLNSGVSSFLFSRSRSSHSSNA